jgi:hypothetical protein
LIGLNILGAHEALTTHVLGARLGAFKVYPQMTQMTQIKEPISAFIGVICG